MIGISAEEALDQKYGIAATEEFRQEVDDMCNYSDVIARNAAEKDVAANGV